MGNVPSGPVFSRFPVSIKLMLTAAIVALSCCGADIVHFRSPTHQYGADYPSGWLQWNQSDLEIANFRESEGLHGGLLPVGGARIQVRLKPQKFSSKTLEEWANSAVTTDPKDVISIARANLGKACIEVHGRFEIGPGVSYEQYSCYLDSGGRQFVVALVYRQGDRRAPIYRAAYETVVRSFRAD